MKKLLASYTKETGQAGFEVAFTEYSSNWGSTPTQTTIKKAAVDIGTDFLFLVPAQTAIYLHAANARSGQLLHPLTLTLTLTLLKVFLLIVL